MSDPKKLRIDELLPGGKGTFTVNSDETEAEIAHRLAQDAKDQDQKRQHESLDKHQARRHDEIDYWTTRGVFLAVICLAVWLLNKGGSTEPAMRFAWGLIGSVVGAVLGMLKGSVAKK